MHMAYDWFIDENPDVQERVAKGEERGKEKGLQTGLEKGLEKGLQTGLEKGLQTGLEKGLQLSALKVVRIRFPALVELAQARILSINNQGELDHLVDQLLIAPDEISTRKLLMQANGHNKDSSTK